MPAPFPPGVVVRSGDGRNLGLLSPVPVAPGSVLEFELLLGARPLRVMARVVQCQNLGPLKHALETQLLAMAQFDMDALADFVQAVGVSSLRVRARLDG